jgi:O-antigen ligase
MVFDLHAVAPLLLAVFMILYIPVGLSLVYNSGIDPGIDTDLLRNWSLLKQIFIFACIVLIVVSPPTLMALRSTYPLWPFLAIATASIVWSADPKSTWLGIEQLIGTVIVLPAILFWLGDARAFRTVSLFNGLIMVASVVAVVVLRSRAIVQASDTVGAEYAGAWRGVMVHKNVLGEAAADTLLILLQQFSGKRFLWLLFCVCTALCLVFARSSTPLLGFAAGFGAFVVLQSRALSRPIALTLIVLTVGLLVFGLSIGVDTIAGLVGRSSDFSGRVPIWRFAIDLIQQHLWLGQGYNTSETIFKARSTVALFADAVNAHNGYLDLAFDVGVVGASALVLGVAAMLFRVYKIILHGAGAERAAAICYVSVVIASLVMAIDEAVPLRADGPGAAAFYLALGAISQLRGLSRIRPSPDSQSPVGIRDRSWSRGLAGGAGRI